MLKMIEHRTVKDLINELQHLDQNAEVWLPAVNDLGISSYCVLDHIQTFKFCEVEHDIYNNPGEIDDRLLTNKREDSPIVFLGSLKDFMPLRRENNGDNS